MESVYLITVVDYLARALTMLFPVACLSTYTVWIDHEAGVRLKVLPDQPTRSPAVKMGVSNRGKL